MPRKRWPGPAPTDPVARFWSKVDLGGPGECWNWKAGTCAGYGAFHVARPVRRIRAHRYAYELANGPLRNGNVVRHTCDNPLCVNPEHLRVGTQAENMADAVDRGRRPKGDQCTWKKLTFHQVLEIRTRHRQGGRQAAIARDYGVSRSHVCNIVNGKARVEG